MQDLLFLAHRIPYPPDKGDKIRSWHFLRHLAQRYRVHLGCFVDDPRDWEFERLLRGICHECCLIELDPARARRRSLSGLLKRTPLTLPYYSDRRLHEWVRDILARQQLTRVFTYCSAMAQYVMSENRASVRRVVDFVDLDSQKWFDYAGRTQGAKRWALNREGRKLRSVERQVASAFDKTLLATKAEADLLRSVAPELAPRIAHIGNGVDSDYFSPETSYHNPYRKDQVALVFTGAMDYWPNVDAVTHFARSVLPLVRDRMPDVSFFIVGSNPKPEVLALASDRGIVVTGRVPDVRPYVAHARVVVAPLRIARGVQNKVLEGMAMARPVVATPQALEGIGAEVGSELLVAEAPDAFAGAVCEAAEAAVGASIGANARQRVLVDYGWPASLRRLDAVIDG